MTDGQCLSVKGTRIFSIEHIKNVTIFSPPYESIQTSKFYSSSLSSLNILYSLLSDNLTDILLDSNSISNTMIYTYQLFSSFPFNSSLSSTSLHTSLLSSTTLHTSSLSSTSLHTSSLSSTSLHTSSLSSTSTYFSIISSSSFSSTNILHSNSISSISNSISISINNNSNFIISSIKNSDLISYNSILKCDKYLNYERNKCIDFIPLGFYLYDKEKGLIEKCHESCNSCIIGPNENSNNCAQCKNNSYFHKRCNLY